MTESLVKKQSAYTTLASLAGSELLLCLKSGLTYNLPVSLLASAAALASKVDKDGAKVLSDINFSTAYKNKLDGITAGATANASDACLLARANHTGVQAISTVTGLQGALDQKVPVSHLSAVNPHSITPSVIGLGNVNNTSDLNKPLSTAAVSALSAKLEVTGTPEEGDVPVYTEEGWVPGPAGSWDGGPYADLQVTEGTVFIPEKGEWENVTNLFEINIAENITDGKYIRMQGYQYKRMIVSLKACIQVNSSPALVAFRLLYDESPVAGGSSQSYCRVDEDMNVCFEVMLEQEPAKPLVIMMYTAPADMYDPSFQVVFNSGSLSMNSRNMVQPPPYILINSPKRHEHIALGVSTPVSGDCSLDVALISLYAAEKGSPLIFLGTTVPVQREDMTYGFSTDVIFEDGLFSNEEAVLLTAMYEAAGVSDEQQVSIRYFAMLSPDFTVTPSATFSCIGHADIPDGTEVTVEVYRKISEMPIIWAWVPIGTLTALGNLITGEIDCSALEVGSGYEIRFTAGALTNTYFYLVVAE